MTQMIPTLLNGRWELSLPEHRAARYEWSHPPYWEPERLDSMYANLRPGDVVYDIGAEEGDMPALFQSWIGPIGGVVLVEPNPLVWPNIRAIWEANELPVPFGWFVGFASDSTNRCPHAMPVDAIQGVSEAEDGWPVCAHGPVIGDHGFRNVSERTHDTPQITIDDLVAQTGRPPTAITMDIEGAELVALRGARDTLTRYRPLVWVSFHEQFMAEMYGTSRADMNAYMHSVGYEPEFIALDHEEHLLFRPLYAWTGS